MGTPGPTREYAAGESSITPRRPVNSAVEEINTDAGYFFPGEAAAADTCNRAGQ
jgi:hypothetical protein